MLISIFPKPDARKEDFSVEVENLGDRFKITISYPTRYGFFNHVSFYVPKDVYVTTHQTSGAKTLYFNMPPKDTPVVEITFFETVNPEVSRAFDRIVARISEEITPVEELIRLGRKILEECAQANKAFEKTEPHVRAFFASLKNLLGGEKR